jgi:hypothetical protein
MFSFIVETSLFLGVTSLVDYLSSDEPTSPPIFRKLYALLNNEVQDEKLGYFIRSLQRLANTADLEFMKIQISIALGVVGGQSTVFLEPATGDTLEEMATRLGFGDVEEGSQDSSYSTMICRNLLRSFTFMGAKVAGDTMDMMLYNVGSLVSKDPAWKRFLAGRISSVSELDSMNATGFGVFLTTASEYDRSNESIQVMFDRRLDLLIEKRYSTSLRRQLAQSIFEDLVAWVALEDM